MKKKLILFITLIVILGICVSAAVFSASGTENDDVKDMRAAAQAYKKIFNGDISFDTDTSNPDERTIVGYYKDIPITQDQVIYIQAMSRAQRNPEDPAWRSPDKTEREAIFEIVRDLYTFEQAKELGLYPSEEEMEEAFVSETESFQKNLDENLEFCSQIDFTQDELIVWMTQLRIEDIAKARFMSQVLISLQEKEDIEDEVLAELVQALLLREDGTDLLSTFDKFYDRYITLQIGDQITYVNKSGSVETE